MKKIIKILLIISIIFGLYRIYPYFFSDVPLWYDPGLYRVMFYQYINNLPNIDFSNLYLWVKQTYPPFLWILWDIFHIVWFNVDFLLTFGLWFSSIITSIFVYALLKKYWKIAWFLWIIIFLLSIIQYKAFWWNYYKQIIWIIFILAGIYLLEKRKNILLVPILMSLFTIHRPSWLYFLLIIIVYRLLRYFFYKEKDYKDLIYIWLAWIIAFLMYLPFLNELILPLLKPLITTVWAWHSGTFFSKLEFWKLEFLIIITSFYWFYLKIKKRDFDLIFSWYVVWALWVWLGLFFYNRFYIFFDVFIILLSAYGFYNIYSSNKKIFYILFLVFFWIQSVMYISYLNKNGHALIDTDEFNTIKKINNIVESGSIMMVTHKNYSPWIHWYTLKSTIAPWLFDWNLWWLDNWKQWWFSHWDFKCSILKEYIDKYHKNIYIWLWKRQPKSNYSWDCFEMVLNWNDYKLLKVNKDYYENK